MDTPTNKEQVIIVISTDILLHMVSRTEICNTLLEGNDEENAVLIEGDADVISILVKECYDAREKGIPLVLPFKNRTIIFR